MSVVDARFVPLEELLRPRPAVETAASPPVPDDVAVEMVSPPPARDMTEALRSARLFHATVADAVASACARLLRDVAADVLARELRLAPVDIAAIIGRVISECPDEPVRVRVAPCDVHVACGFPVVADETLQAGDVIVEFVHGTVDARLGVRLADVLIAATL
jgi:flagellar biosynthesis/type III secretory pathway protein FliH